MNMLELRTNLKSILYLVITVFFIAMFLLVSIYTGFIGSEGKMDYLPVYAPFFTLVGLLIFWIQRVYRNLVAPLLSKMLELEKDLAIRNAYRQVAHDIRSPLAVLELSKGGTQSNPELMDLAIERIKTIANDLLEEGHISGGFFNLYDHVANLMKLKEREFGNSARLHFSFESRDAICFFSPKELPRILSNLINNAVEAYSGDKERLVQVSLQTLEKGFVLSIKDFGNGMEESFVSHFLESGRSSKDTGYGLGLNRLGEFMERAKGKFEIKSSLGEGTEIRLLFLKTEK